MNELQFKKAVKFNSKLRLAISGPAKSGKTFSALSIATAIGGRIALIDTEHSSAAKYADLFDFDTLSLKSFSMQDYEQAIRAAVKAGYDILIIDSLSHAWAGMNGALEMVDKQEGNKFTSGWKTVSPLWSKFIDTILAADLHVIGTLRVKTDYIIEIVTVKGREQSVPRKVGMAPIFRQDADYEFDVMLEMNLDHIGMVTSSRCLELDHVAFDKPGEEFAAITMQWLQGKTRPEDEPISDDQLKEFYDLSVTHEWTPQEIEKLLAPKYKHATEVPVKFFPALTARLVDDKKHQEIFAAVMKDNEDQGDA